MKDSEERIKKGAQWMSESRYLVFFAGSGISSVKHGEKKTKK